MSVINKLLGKFFGSKSKRDIKTVMPLVEQTNKVFKSLSRISNDELRARTEKLKEIVKKSISTEEQTIADLKKEAESLVVEMREEIYDQIDSINKDIDALLEKTLDSILPEAFAIVKETARRFKENETLEATASDFDRKLAVTRNDISINNDKVTYKNKWLAGGNEITWDMIHYDVQLIGGIILHRGKIAEMATGEGKTLVATLPVFLNALTGRGVHIVTVNDYLAKRDSEWMGTLYEFHGLSVDCIDRHEPNSPKRIAAYNADVTFGTNNEFGFDYLRDNMAHSPDGLVQRKHNYTIVDEVDSVLVDDARTPLIISGATGSKRDEKQLFDDLKPKVIHLFQEQRKLCTALLVEAKKLIAAGDTKKGGLSLLRSFKGMPKNNALIKYMSLHGMKALVHETENIYLAENAKRMPELVEELFFVIEEKHNSVEMTDKGIDLISTDAADNLFFIIPDIGLEIAELEKTEKTPQEKLEIKDKLYTDYSIKSERIHTINQLLKAYALFEKDTEYVIVDNKIKIVDEQTGRIMEGRRYSDGLHQAIEAKENVKVEASTQTMATITLQNYFRMYNKLSGMTGTAETEAGELWDIYELDVVVIPTNKPITRMDSEDLIYKTKREKYNAVIEEATTLVNAGRPVLIGTTSVDISELLSRMLDLRKIRHNVLNAKLHKREADIVAEAGEAGIVTIATNMAGRGTDIKLSQQVIKSGGLAIIGTERHESRRVDRQLRGRAGRQGDVGSSQFFVSLEDSLMRIFGSDKIAKLMDRMGLKDGEVIQHSMISKSIERAQKKVEENNFGMRKRLLEYDDVMNSQREVVYKQRRHALHGDRIEVDITNMIFDVCLSITEQNHDNGDFETFKFDLLRHLSIEPKLDEDEFLKTQPEAIAEKLFEQALKNHKEKSALIAKTAMPVINNIHETQAATYKEILIPVSDGRLVYNVILNLEEAVESQGRELVRGYQKAIVLKIIDDSWKDHLRRMDDLKQSVQNASYEQKDPLLIFKFESYNLFKDMLDKNNRAVVLTLMKAHIPINSPEDVEKAQRQKRTERQQRLETSKQEANTYLSSSNGSNKRAEKQTVPVRVEKKVGRNELCPCGSGKKYKHCCGRGE